jgi:hypothetical protein
MEGEILKRKEKIKETTKIAKKFIELANLRLKEFEDDFSYEFRGIKISGALRRVSLDLSRALAEMRKP